MAVFHSNDAPQSSSDLDYIDDEHTAARAYLALKHNGADRTIPLGQRQQAHRLLLELVDRWPDVADTAANAADHELDLEGNPELRRTREQHRAERGTTAAAAAKARRRKSSTAGSGDTGARRPAARGRTSQSRSRGRGRGGFSRSGGLTLPGVGSLPGTATTGQLVMSALAGTVVLALGYLLLTNADKAPKGAAAVEIIGSGVRSALSTLISPVDPLNRGGVQPQAGHALPGRSQAIADALGKRAQTPAPRASTPVRSPQRRPTHK